MLGRLIPIPIDLALLIGERTRQHLDERRQLVQAMALFAHVAEPNKVSCLVADLSLPAASAALFARDFARFVLIASRCCNILPHARLQHLTRRLEVEDGARQTTHSNSWIFGRHRSHSAARQRRHSGEQVRGCRPRVLRGASKLRPHCQQTSVISFGASPVSFREVPGSSAQVVWSDGIVASPVGCRKAGVH